MPNRAAAPLAVLATLALAASAAASLPEKDVAKTIPLVKGTLSVEAYKGSIRVHTWDRAEVSVKARVVADDSCGGQRDQSEKVEATEVVIEPTSGGASVRAEYDRVEHHFRWFGFGCNALPFVHFEISMPRTAPLRVKDHKSRIHVADLDGDLTLDTYKGRAELAGLGGGVDITTYKGEVRAETALRKETSVETYKGEVTLTVPKGAAFTVDEDLGRRARLDSDFDLVSGTRHASRRGSRGGGAVNGGGPLLRLTSEKGEIRLRAR